MAFPCVVTRWYAAEYRNVVDSHVNTDRESEAGNGAIVHGTNGT